MPATVEIDQTQGIRVLTGTGVLRAADFIEANKKINTDPEMSAATRSLVDLRDASLSELTAEEVRAVVALPLPRPSQTRTAIVATTPVAFGMARMYSMLREDHHSAREVQVFADYDEAVTWLLRPA